MLFIHALLSRLKSETPRFFKLLQKYALYVLVLLGVLIAVCKLELIPMAYQIEQIANYGIAFFAAVGGTSALACQDPNESPPADENFPSGL